MIQKQASYTTSNGEICGSLYEAKVRELTEIISSVDESCAAIGERVATKLVDESDRVLATLKLKERKPRKKEKAARKPKAKAETAPDDKA